VGRPGEQRAHRPDPSEPADHRLERRDVRVPAAGLAHHEQLAGGLGGRGQRQGLRDCRRHGLLAEDREAGRERRHSDRVVGLGNGHVDDGVCAGPPGHLDEVGAGQDRCPVCGGRRLRRGEVQVDDAGEHRVGRPGDGLQPGATHAAGPDDDQAQRTVRRDRPERRAHRLDSVSSVNSSPVS
jgi:hypothetical protein